MGRRSIMPVSIRQHDDVDRLPPGSGNVEQAPWPTSQPRGYLPWPTVMALCVFAVILLLVCYWLFAADVRDWVRYGDGATFVWWVPRLLVGAAVAYVFKRLFFVEQDGIKVPVSAYRQVAARDVITDLIEVRRTYAANDNRNVRALTYSPTYHHQVETNSEALPALPAPEDVITLTLEETWLRWVDRAPHLLLAGKTEAGKSTMASALLSERIIAGDQILVLDPHYQPGKWFGAEAISGVPAILETLPALISELEARYEEFKRGKQTEEFERLTVLIDEVPAIVEQCIEMTPSGRPKVTDWRWRRFAKRLGSEARKVRISVVLLSQSTLVQDLMINVQMKENFTRIGLGDQARPLLAEEDDTKRKHVLMDLLRGQAHPAAMEHWGEFFLLDTSGVPSLAERNVRGRVRAWNPDDAPALGADPDDTAALGALLAAPAMHSAISANNGNGRKNGNSYHSAIAAMPDQDAEELAIEYFAAGLSQREVGRLIRERGLTIDQNDFPRLQREGLKRRKGT